MPHAPGQIPPHGGDTNKGSAILGVCMAFMTCALLSTIMRVWVRAGITRNMGWDDWNMVAAAVRNRHSSMWAFKIIIHVNPGNNRLGCRPDNCRIRKWNGQTSILPI